jgi:hypothetical protein
MAQLPRLYREQDSGYLILKAQHPARAIRLVLPERSLLLNSMVMITGIRPAGNCIMGSGSLGKGWEAGSRFGF